RTASSEFDFAKHCRGRAGGRALEDSHNNSIPWCAVLNRGTEPVLRTVVQGQRGQRAFGGGQLLSPTVGHRHNHRYDGRVWLGSRERAEHHGDKNERDTSPSHTSLLFPFEATTVMDTRLPRVFITPRA